VGGGDRWSCQRATPQTGRGQGDDAQARRLEGNFEAMNHHEPGISYPRGRDDWVRDHPFASRLLIMIVGFALLVPVAIVVRSSQGNVVRSGGLPGASLGADPLIVPSSTSTTTPSPLAAVAGSTTAPANAPAAAATTAPGVPATAGASMGPRATVESAQAAPATTAKKQTTTTEAAPATTAKQKATTVVTTTKPTNPPTTKAAPSTTEAPPATTPAPTSPTTEAAVVAPPENTHSREELEAIIRSVFPPEEADEAVRVASRESNLVPTVRNWCCFGLFQIYFEVNRKTLAALGITEAAQLFDPWVNTQAAYALFQRSGWAPWR
jgi:hypothetical protein